MQLALAGGSSFHILEELQTLEIYWVTESTTEVEVEAPNRWQNIQIPFNSINYNSNEIVKWCNTLNFFV